MTQVFISYSRKDLAFVKKLAADLQAAGLDVWYDLSGLEGGQRWRIEIEKAIRASQYVLVVLSPDSTFSEWVEREYLFANNLKKQIIPLFYKPCDLPLYYLNVHYIDVQDKNYKRNFDEILRALGVQSVVPKPAPEPENKKVSSKNLEKEKKVTPKPESKKPALKINKRIVVGIFGLAVFVLAGIFGFRYAADLFSPPPETNATATFTKAPRIFNATEAAFISKVAPTQAPQTATVSAVLTNVEVSGTQSTAGPQLPTKITDGFGVEMVLVPAGEFIMGNNDGFDNERPAHTVFLNSFYIDAYEVTNVLYAVCVDASVCTPPQETSSYTHVSYYGNLKYNKFPVINVNWNQAKAYCAWRNAQLPTEAQWEKAVRNTDERTYPWGNEIDCNKANFRDENEECIGDTTVVGSYEGGISPFGVYDMAGNVWEIVDDWYDAYPGETI